MMRSFGAAALLILAIVTESLGAHSDRSRQRSSPIRSVPVAADIKRDVNFNCPEEFGYYPHPTDCTLYYVCVFGGALLESCTGGLMYSHELQTCDWPRNVGCDGTSGISDDLERISEREPPPPPPPRRTPPPPPPPPPRAQPNPVVTSRGQPKFNRDEYQKQQQLYAEVDDLPPVEEIESDRQQRVNRGQPPTIGQVQKDRDGYVSQVVSSGRNLNSNIIPASIQNSKVGSFSFGTQVDDRRSAVVTQAPQAYSADKPVNVTDYALDRLLDIETNEINVDDVTEKTIKRRKRDLLERDVGTTDKNSTGVDEMAKRSDRDEEIEFSDVELESTNGDDIEDDSERGKRQIRYYVKNGYNNKPAKNWAISKPYKIVNIPQYNYNSNQQSARYQSPFNGLSNSNLYETNRNPFNFDDSLYAQTADSYPIYQVDGESRRPFKPSLPDPFNQKYIHNPANIATQIITKSPPISALKNMEIPFALLAGGFYNNAPKQITSTNRPNHHFVFPDASQVPSTVVTGKPVLIGSSPRPTDEYRTKQKVESDLQPQKDHNTYRNVKELNQQSNNKAPSESDYKDRDNSSDEDYKDRDNSESSENYSSERDDDDNDDFKHKFPKPPFEFTHPNHKYAEIENPFANPNFDFDAYLARLSNGQYSSTPKYKNVQMAALRATNSPMVSTTASQTAFRSSTLNYQGMSTPKPFTLPFGPGSSPVPLDTLRAPAPTGQWIQKPGTNQQSYVQQEPSLDPNSYKLSQQNAGLPLEAVKPNLRPPNFKDERQLPITYSFNKPLDSTPNPAHDHANIKNNQQLLSVSHKPYTVFSTGAPTILSTPKQQYFVKAEKIISIQPQKPYYAVSTANPLNSYSIFKHSTAKPLTTIANEQLSALQNFWSSRSPSVTESHFSVQSTPRPNAVSEVPKIHNFSIKPSAIPIKSNIFANIAKNPISSTTVSPKRRPIPKPSPEMNDYYYDDDEYYYEPPVKSKYMPSSEVKPKRPPMAQNYRQYDDYSYEELDERPVNKPLHTSRLPTAFTTLKPATASKTPNELSGTKVPIKDFNKIIDGKIAVPVIYNTPKPTVVIRPDLSNYKIVHQSPRNRTFHMKNPMFSTSGPFTARPPKYLNQTTLRPYTVRHRLAKPTTVKESVTIPPTRHPNIVTQTKFTTPRDSHNQETRYTKTRHDDKLNSLEPTESIAPVSYSASPRPKMLYNGSQNYSPDQYDPYYAVYDEDGELYKDTDYVQQYNTGSLRPAVQQTYRGTPPSRRPIDNYTPRPVSSDDYDEALIQGQINQNQYQSAIRHSTRGEGNELGYDHNPSSVRTSAYEATSVSTTPSTTSTITTTTTTTQRPTTAPFTEAMTPSRYTTRSESPTDENPSQKPESLSSESPKDEPELSVLPTSPSYINLSSLAKPFERTDNTHRLKETFSSTEKLPTIRLSSRVTNNNDKGNVDMVRSKNAQNNKKVVSLTSGFSIRRNPNNTNNPYTLTVLSRPFEDYDKVRRVPLHTDNNERYTNKINFNANTDNQKKSLSEEVFKTELNQNNQTPKESNTQRKDASPEIISEEDDIPIYVRPTRIKTTSTTKIFTTPRTTTKYYIKSIVRRPTPFSVNNTPSVDSTENSINTVDVLIDTALQNAKTNANFTLNDTVQNTVVPNKEPNDVISESWNEPVVSPYRTLDNLRNSFNDKDDNVSEYTTSTTTRAPIEITSSKSRRGPSYYTYSVVDDDSSNDQTTEVFSGKVKNVIKAFFNNFVTPIPKTDDNFSTTTTKPTTETVVNIGHQMKTTKYNDEKPPRFNNVKRLQIMTEPTINTFVTPNHDTESYTDKMIEINNDYLLSTTPSQFSSTTPTAPMLIESSTINEFRQNAPYKQSHESKFISLVTKKPDIESSRKFHRIVTEPVPKHETNSNDDIIYNIDEAPIKLTRPNVEITDKVINEIASTTSTTKSTVTMKNDPTSTTKSLPFPTRASRVNPAIKLAATNPGGGRRSYQSATKCSSDNSLQANPKCNEIKYQRPTNTRGRGSAHYSTLNGGDGPQPSPNRGTPPTRSRPTLKPSTAIVSKSTEFVDIYAHPPGRPGPVYPQPTPDKTAAKCRKDVCLLPDCYCGGKDIPGDLPLETVPQIVLLTFDDSVNDLNKGLYTDLFEKGRVNPNGCPIAATFYVSHEWTDYSQVQNLYAAGHEMASHTISHSFGEQFSQKKWNREVGGQREILAAYGGVKLEDVRGMRAPFLSVGGNKMFKMLYDSNFTYDSSLPVYENRPPSWPYTLDYKLFHDCMIPPCPTKSYPGVWEVPMVMWQDLNGGRCSMGDACANPPDAEGVYKMILKNFDRHYTTNRAPFGLYYHAAWFTQPHHKEGFIMFLDFINQMQDVWIVTNWQGLQWVRDPTPISRINNFQPFQCNYPDRPRKCNNPKVCNLWHKSGVRYMRTCQPCPEIYPWTGKTGIRSSRIDNDIGE